jgi:hypothetical protein
LLRPAPGRGGLRTNSGSARFINNPQRAKRKMTSLSESFQSVRQDRKLQTFICLSRDTFICLLQCRRGDTLVRPERNRETKQSDQEQIIEV